MVGLEGYGGTRHYSLNSNLAFLYGGRQASLSVFDALVPSITRLDISFRGTPERTELSLKQLREGSFQAICVLT